jgi:uncharacterized protein (TIGR02594 family)
MVRAALDLLGTKEIAGAADNPVILAWAKEIEQICHRPYDDWAADFFKDDSIPWCGLFVGIVAARTCQGRPERMPPKNYLSALAWSNWGNAATASDIRLGDVVVLHRVGGGHVFLALGVSTDGARIIGIGGNQSDAVTFAEFDIGRLHAVRRPVYQKVPGGARRVVLDAHGELSVNEV